MKILYFIFDILLLPVTFILAFIFYIIRSVGERRLTLCNKVLLAKGILPVRTYFEEQLRKS